MATATKESVSAAPISSESESLLDQVIAATCLRIDNIAAKYHDAVAEAEGRISRAMLMANGIEKLRQALTPDVMRQFMALQGSHLGFRTDRDDKGGYPVDVVRECLIEALMTGVYPTGNQFNIIASRCYITKEGYYHLVTNIKGLTDLDLIPGTPRGQDGNTVVNFAATWKYNGHTYQLLNHEGKPGRQFTIRVNAGMGPDAILGKATRKALKAIYQRITGTETTMPDAEVGEDLLNQVLANTEQQRREAQVDGPPAGRSSFKPNTNGTAHTEATPVKQEAAPAPLPNPVQANEDSGWITDWMSDMGEKFLKASSSEELQILGVEMMKQQAAIGEENYRKVLSAYQARYREINPQGPTVGDQKPKKK